MIISINVPICLNFTISQMRELLKAMDKENEISYLKLFYVDKYILSGTLRMEWVSKQSSRQIDKSYKWMDYRFLD